MTDPHKTEEPRGSSTPTVGWPFWRTRIARALVIAALALIVTQLLPALPEEQFVRLKPPPGVELTRATLIYYTTDGGDPLSGTELVPAAPAPFLTHTLRLPSADYRISIQAVGADSSGAAHRYSETQTVSLSGSVAEVLLHTSKPAN
jgi:hypothetical protein